MKIKVSLGLLAILASTLYLSGCCAQSSSLPTNASLVQVPDLQDEPLNTSGAVGLAGMQEKTLYENTTYGFMITYPNDWTMQEAEPNNMGLVAGFLAPDEDMDNPMVYVTVQIEELPPEQKITLDEYTGSILENLKSTYPGFPDSLRDRYDHVRRDSARNRLFCDRPADSISDIAGLCDKR